jgi:hypothetical protein
VIQSSRGGAARGKDSFSRERRARLKSAVGSAGRQLRRNASTLEPTTQPSARQGPPCICLTTACWPRCRSP